MSRPNPIVPLLVTAVLAATPATAQSPVLDHGSRTSAWLQLQRPSFDGGGSAWLANAGIAASAGAHTQVFLEVPFVYVSEAGVDKKSLLGNPYLAFRANAGTSYFEAGVRAPAVGDNAGLAPMAIGLMSDFDNAEAYMPNVATVLGALGYNGTTVKDGLVPHIRAGVSAWIPTKGGGDTQLMANYTGLLGYRAGSLEVMGGLTGRFIVNHAENASLAERTIHQGVIGVTWRQGGVRPTLFVRMPLDQDAKDMYNSVFGLGVSLDLR